jgi:hypothetical protein
MFEEDKFHRTALSELFRFPVGVESLPLKPSMALRSADTSEQSYYQIHAQRAAPLALIQAPCAIRLIAVTRRERWADSYPYFPDATPRPV